MNDVTHTLNRMRCLSVLMAILMAASCESPLRMFETGAHSMSPTIMPGEKFEVDCFAYENAEPQRWDIIVFRYPKDHSQYFVLRVIGLPGEVLEINNGRVVVNGLPLSIPEKLQNIFKNIPVCLYPESTVSVSPTIPPRCYYVLGDNVRRSNDSRTWGHLRRDLIIGKVLNK